MIRKYFKKIEKLLDDRSHIVEDQILIQIHLQMTKD